MQNKFISILKFILGFPLSLIALIFIIKLFLSNSNRIEHLPNINFGILILSFVFFFLYYFQRANLWSKIVNVKSDKNISFLRNAYLWESAEIKRFIPGNVWSIFTRVTSFSNNKNINKKTAFYLYFLEAIYISTADLILSIFSISLIESVYKKLYLNPLYIFLIIGGIILFLILFIFIILKKSERYKKLIKVFEGFGIKKNIYLLVNALISESLFGIGSYFSVVAIFNLPAKSFLEVSSILIFARLIGYLSILTPMGLGVREAIVTAGLLKFLSTSASALTSIFSRLILIISEVSFFVIVTLTHRMENKFKRLEDLIFKYKHEILLVFFISSYVTYFLSASVLRYQNFFTGRFDLGNMDQTVWNTIHGRIFMLTDPNGTNIVSRLSQHADFILILLAPFYLIWQDPRMLLLIQTLTLAIGGVFIYLIAKDLFKNKNISLAFSISYLLYPALEQSNLYDFHAATIIPTFFLAAFYFLKRKKYLLMCLFLLLAGFCKEDVWFIIFIFGIYVFWFSKKKLLGILISVISLTLFIYLTFILIPHFHEGTHLAVSYFSDFGTTPTQIIKNIFLDPKRTVLTITSKERLLYLNQLFLPVGYLIIFSPLFLIIPLDNLIFNLLSTNSAPHEIYYQYTGEITAFIFLASIYGVYFLRNKLKNISINFYIIFILFFSLLSSYLYGPLPFDKNPNIDMFDKQVPNRTLISDFLNDIGPNYTIAASNNLGSHLSHRENIFTIPVGFNKADIVAFLLNDQFAQPSLKDQRKMTQDLRNNKNYIEVIKLDDFIVFEKRNLYIAKKPEVKSTKIFPVSIDSLETRDFKSTQINVGKISVSKKDDIKILSANFYPDGVKTNLIIYKPNDSKIYPVVLMPFYPINKNTSDNEYSLYLKAAENFSKNGFIAIILLPNSDPDNISLSNNLEMPIQTLDLLSSLNTLNNTNYSKVYLWGEGIGSQIVLSAISGNNHNINENTQILAGAVWSPIINTRNAFNYFNITVSSPNAYSKFADEIKSYSNQNLLWNSLSPQFYLSDIKSPINITSFSNSIPDYLWATELYNDLKSEGKNAQISLNTKISPFDDDNNTYLDKDVKFFNSFKTL